jgi:hypothetical protein
MPLPRIFLSRVDADIVQNFCGDFWDRLQRHNGPSPEELRAMLVGLRQHLNWSRPMLGALLGVPRDTVRRWESGQRNLSGAARKLVWLVYTAILSPERLGRSLLDIIFWGQRQELLELHKAVVAQSEALEMAFREDQCATQSTTPASAVSEMPEPRDRNG